MTSLEFIADFHVHSKYSRATAKNLDLENLYIAAQIKGITVVGTGDFTHPGWFSEISEKLIPAEPGLFKLKPEIAVKCDESVPGSCRNLVRFILAGEISNIYKKNGKTRKNHNLVFLPDLEAVASFNAVLDRIGNIKSDGRPILGLDARDLLEILLEADEAGFLIPAHIWTPWFSLLGSKSGFDSLEECFEDLTPHIFAVETGLSSDPAMNWQVSGLDNLTLVSNSDAHSPFTLGREANRFNTPLTYSDIRTALETGHPDQFLGTLEFYPEEGKYHFDGHRKCRICYHPQQSIAADGTCPICSKPLTLGVLHRVEELADRKKDEKPGQTNPFDSIIPLADILSDIFRVGPKSKKVTTHFDTAVRTLGPEFKILCSFSREELDKTGIPLLGEAISRVRTGKVHISPGYDGEFGVVSIFRDGERRRLMGQKSLFAISENEVVISGDKDYPPHSSESFMKKKAAHIHAATGKEQFLPFESALDIFSSLNPEQKEVVIHKGGPLLISAGPGTGKTRTITHRIAYLIQEKGVPPVNILAATFTIKAAQEMKRRLEALFRNETLLPHISTFHSLCHTLLSEQYHTAGDVAHTIIDDQDQLLLVREALARATANNNSPAADAADLLDWIILAKQQVLGPEDDLSGIDRTVNLNLYTRTYKTYQNLLSVLGALDYEDLIFRTVKMLENNAQVKSEYQKKFEFIFVDEYQDVNHGQYRIIRALSPSNKNLCAIGDPDQSIYGFRGSDPKYFRSFLEDYPGAKSISLSRNYRSTETILNGSYYVIRKQTGSRDRSERVYSDITGIKTITVLDSASEKGEAVAIGKAIEKMVGGIGFHSIDFNRSGIDTAATHERSFSDFAVLYRTRNQGGLIADVLEKGGIPCQIVSRYNMLSEKGIRELVSYFKILEDCGTLMDFERILGIPGSGVGRQTLDKFRAWYFQKKIGLTEAFSLVKRFPLPGLSNKAQLKLDLFISGIQNIKKEIEGLSVEDKLQRLSRLPSIENILKHNRKADDNLLFLFSSAKPYQTNAVEFLNALTLHTDTDTYDAVSQKVKLLTMHAAKGLEFPVVFIAGCEQGLIPYVPPNDAPWDMNEERRLFYVAMTRAREHLILSWSKKRKLYGETTERRISPFVGDIEEQLIKQEAAYSGKKKAQTQLQLF